MFTRFAPIASGVVLLFVAASCSSSRSSIAGTLCDGSTPSATLVYPRPDARNVATSLSEIVVSGARLDAVTKISLIDGGGQQLSIGPLVPAIRRADERGGVSDASAQIPVLAPEMSYIVLYSSSACGGDSEYAIGSFTTE